MPLKLEVMMAGHLSLYVFHSVFNSQRIDEIQEYIDLMVCKYLNTNHDIYNIMYLMPGNHLPINHVHT